MRTYLPIAILLLGTSAAFGGEPSATPTLESLKRQLEAQQAQLDALTAQLEHPIGSPSATRLGGYGEVLYENLASGHTIDFARFVLSVEHDFSASIHLVSELEVEHAVASSGDPGEVALEQGYLEFAIGAATTLKAGLFLVPVGILNESHEPPVFYGVARNPVETLIVPTTWREAGVAFSGPIGDGGFSYDLALHSGLAFDGSFDVANAHQEAALAVANDLALSARLRYRNGTGVEVAGTVVHQSDATQGAVAGSGPATLVEAHAAWSSGPFTVRALGARWDLAGPAAASAGKGSQHGAYLEGDWRAQPTLGFFARYSAWDTGGASGAFAQWDTGVDWWLHPDVVVKLDFETQTRAGTDRGFSLGLGFRF